MAANKPELETINKLLNQLRTSFPSLDDEQFNRLISATFRYTEAVVQEAIQQVFEKVPDSQLTPDMVKENSTTLMLIRNYVEILDSVNVREYLAAYNEHDEQERLDTQITTAIMPDALLNTGSGAPTVGTEF